MAHRSKTAMSLPSGDAFVHDRPILVDLRGDYGLMWWISVGLGVFAALPCRLPVLRNSAAATAMPIGPAVIELPVAHAVAPAAARDQVGRQIHVLHSAGQRSLDCARHDLVGCRKDCLRARAANAVDGHRWDRDR